MTELLVQIGDVFEEKDTKCVVTKLTPNTGANFVDIHEDGREMLFSAWTARSGEILVIDRWELDRVIGAMMLGMGIAQGKKKLTEAEKQRREQELREEFALGPLPFKPFILPR